jgi:replicative DNA helicase
VMGLDRTNAAPPAAVPTTIRPADLVGALVADVAAAQKAKASGIPRGPVMGLSKLDAVIGNYLAPGVHVVQGAPGAGKTALTQQVSARCFYPCLYVSAEMGLLELFRRHVARETGTYLGKLKSGEIGEREAQRLALATVERLEHLRLMDATAAYAPFDLLMQHGELLGEGSRDGHVLIIIDSLHAWAKSRRRSGGDVAGLDEYSLVNYALEDASLLASRLSCPVLLVAHRNRQGNKGGDPLTASKGSGDIEYTVETVVDLTPKKSDEDADGTREVTAFFAKNRNGAVGASVSLRFNGGLQEFTE